MFLRKAVSIALKRRTLALAGAILAVAAPAALAATLFGDGTLVGTTGSDTIAAGNGNDTVWGLGGADTISTGKGNDVIDGNGHCPAGVQTGKVYPNGLPVGEYCEHGPIPGRANGDTISAGNGSDTIYGGGGLNTISAGNGNDTIYGGLIGDTISAGNGNDTITLGGGSTYTGSTVSVASGKGVIYAQNGVKDTITCATKNNYTVYADKKIDVVSHCATISYAPEPSETERRRRRSTRSTSTAKREQARKDMTEPGMHRSGHAHATHSGWPPSRSSASRHVYQAGTRSTKPKGPQ